MIGKIDDELTTSNKREGGSGGGAAGDGGAHYLTVEFLKSLKELRIKLESYLQETLGNRSIVKMCSLSKRLILFSLFISVYTLFLN